MLVLSRKQNERIRVGESVVVTIVRVNGDKVRIGIEAPSEMRVLRDELEIDALGDVILEDDGVLPISSLCKLTAVPLRIGSRDNHSMVSWHADFVSSV